MIPESVITMPGITDHDPGIGDHVKSESVITIVRNTQRRRGTGNRQIPGPEISGKAHNAGSRPHVE